MHQSHIVEPFIVERESDLRAILGGQDLHPVSLYVPVDRAPPELHASELRLRAAIDEAAQHLRQRGVRDEEIEARIGRLDALHPPLRSLDAAVRTLVWLGDAQGWAFAPLVAALPARVDVASHYALRPLLRALGRNRRFRLLAVSSNRVATYEGDAQGLHPVRVEGLPASLQDALGSELEGDALSYRSDAPVPGRSAAPIYHGHGGADEERAVDRERFHRILGRVLDDAWGGSDVPIVLAAEMRTAGELRKSVDLQALLPEELHGNPDRAGEEELHARAWPVVCAALETRESELAGAFDRARAAGKALEGDLETVAEAALAGRVRRLWISETARVPGRLDPVTARLVQAEGDDGADRDEDALDGLVAQVITRAGEVRVVDEGGTPTGGAWCAELR